MLLALILHLSFFKCFAMYYTKPKVLRITVSESSSSKFLSRLMLLRFTLRIPISSQQNVISPESSSKNSKPSSAYKAV